MRGKRSKEFGLNVNVGDMPFEKAMRLFKKKVQDSGILKELKDREQYTKPSIDRKLKKSAAKKRWQKTLQSQKIPERKF